MVAPKGPRIETAEAGGTTRARRTGPGARGRYLDRSLVGFAQIRPPERLRITPTPTVTMMLQLGELFRGMPRAFISGLSTRPSEAVPDGAIECIDVKLTPTGAFALFGLPMDELTDTAVDLGHLVGDRAANQFGEQLAAAPGWAGRMQVAEEFLLNRAAGGSCTGIAGPSCVRCSSR